MENKSRRKFTRFLLPVVLVVGLLVICITAVATAVYVYLNRDTLTTPASTATHPLYISSDSEVPMDVVESEREGSYQPVRVSQGQAQPDEPEPLPVVTGEPLTEQEIASITTRLPELQGEPAHQLDLNLPDEPIPPPRTGTTIQDPFPQPAAETAPEHPPSGPLEVLRYSPEGEIPLAPFVSVTFNQPMVPLTSLEELAALDVPVRLAPPLPGTWRWLGVKTLTFEYDSDQIDRMPMSTEYLVSVPAGTRSVTGGELAQTVEWTFSTPPPQITHKYPQDIPQPLDPIVFIAFDQRVEPEAVLKTIQLFDETRPVEIRLASQGEIEAHETISRLVENANPDRWLAFRPENSLPTDTTVTVVVGPGTPSAEGPLLTKDEQRFSFRTYAPLRIEEYGCEWDHDICRPLSPWYIRFNNPLDLQAYDDSLVSITPELPGATVNIYGNTIRIHGATEGKTTYRVTVGADLQDIFGQKLGKDERLDFRIGQAEPYLTGPHEPLVTLDPAADQPSLSVYAINYNKLDVKIYAVEPSDWPAYLKYLRDYYQEPSPQPPGRLVSDQALPVEAPSDVLTEVGIDLSEWLDGGYGHFIVVVQPSRTLNIFDRNQDRYIVHTWVQVTDIGLDAFVDHSQMVAWASDLSTGAPLDQVTISGQPQGPNARTAADGTARFALPQGGISYLVASQGRDLAILPGSTSAWDEGGWQPRPVNDQLRWYVFDDRQMYRPGEQVHVKGWLRRIGGGQEGDVGKLSGEVSSISYQVTGSQGNLLGEGSLPVNALGGFDFVFDLPESVNLGHTQINFTAYGSLSGLDGLHHYHSFQVQEFRRPEFEVQARNETSGPYFVDEFAILAVEAKYYAGDPLPNAEVSWYVSSTPSNYAPPNWPDFNFGFWEPWWWHFGPYFESEYYDPYGPDSEQETFEGRTDATGNHYLRLDFDQYAETRPYSVLAEATVFDVNRQAWTGATSLLVHPGELYVGLRSQRTFVQRGVPLEIDLIVTDLDGNPVADRLVQVRAARMEWKHLQGGWREVEVDPQECQVASELEPVTCTFETEVGGEYQITAEVSDEKGRKNKSQFTRWVSGGQRPPSRKVEQEQVLLIPDRDEYQPGDEALILVQSPFGAAEGLLTVSRSGILYIERFHMDEDTYTLQIPIQEAHIPNLHVQVDLVGSAPRLSDTGETIAGLPPRPAYATGQLGLNVPPLQRQLSLQVTPQESELEPGGETRLDLVLTDNEQQPVAGAELAVVVVDEAILALTNYQMADPLAFFYYPRSADLGSRYGRDSLVLADPLSLAKGGGADLAAGMAATQTASRDMVLEGEAMMEAPVAEAAPADMEESAGQAIRIRSDFNPLATFAPEVRTDAAGRAQVTVNLPDNLTRYRVMVVAVDDGNQFGSAEANLVARLPLMVRPSAPRFLNFGDQFELPVVLQNQTGEPLEVEVVLQASNLKLTKNPGVRVSVPAHDRVEVRFPAAAEMAGTARLQIAAVAGEYADAATIELPVYTPATTEAFATYGVIDEGAVVQPVAAPANVFPQFGGLEINTSSTALHALSDAVLYLTSYPFECTEQLASRILAVAALRDVLTAFSAEGLPSPEEMESAVQRDIDRLAGLQNYDGGFPYWRRDRDSIPFNTIHVAHGLQMARLKGFEVPEEMQMRVLDYLRQIESYYPDYYSLTTRQTLSAYALYVRDLMGDRDIDKARSLLEEAGLEQLSLEATGWLWMVLSDDPGSGPELEAIRRHINNRAVETAGAANFTTSYGDQAYLLLHSNRRTDAILLDALIKDTPDSDLIPKIVNGLLAHRTQGRWSNTQENVFVLLALDRYFNTYEAQTPDFVANIWLGETYAGGHQFSGYSSERHLVEVPMAYLTDSPEATQDLILSKEGPGRLYYRLGLRYAPTDLVLDPLDMGFVVQRTYEAVDDPDDVYRDEDGFWHIKAGVRVRVRLKMVTDNRRYHVALVDPLPAGLEIINPALAVSGSIPQDPSSPDYHYGWWWWGTWYEHQNMRDQRAEAFTSLLWDGVYDYSYVARATTPGIFVAPPSKAEEMYSPEVFGRSASDWVIVE